MTPTRGAFRLRQPSAWARATAALRACAAPRSRMYCNSNQERGGRVFSFDEKGVLERTGPGAVPEEWLARVPEYKGMENGGKTL